MITGFIKHQELRINQPVIVSDTIDYLEAQFKFKTSDWDELTVFAHFKQGNTVYDIQLDDENEIKQDKHLNLLNGVWELYLHGDKFEHGEVVERVTSEITEIIVKKTGVLNGEPFPSAVPSISEQILALIGDMEQLETEDKDTLVNAINEAYNHGGGGGSSTVQVTNDLTLLANDWINNQQTISVKLNVRKRNVIDVYASSVREWSECGVIGITENSNGIVFECDRVPQHDLTFRISSFTVSGEPEPPQPGGLTPEQVEAINQMSAYINNDGELVLDYNDNILDINFEIQDKNLYVDNSLEDLDFNINNNNELEAIYNVN